VHAPVGPAWLVWLESTGLAAWMRTSLWAYPIVEIVHILGFALLVGAAVLWDLRLLGAARSLPVTGLERHLLARARASLLLIVPSGLLMFSAHATEMAANPAFRLKLALIAVAGLNAALFHRFPFRSVAGWDVGAATPAWARVAAVVSLVCWTGAVACGRLLAYL
jgi:hypothetical protein